MCDGVQNGYMLFCTNSRAVIEIEQPESEKKTLLCGLDYSGPRRLRVLYVYGIPYPNVFCCFFFFAIAQCATYLFLVVAAVSLYRFVGFYNCIRK